MADDVDAHPLPGKRRVRPDAGRVARRVAGFKIRQRREGGVQPLNAGFFVLEHMRARAMAKKRTKAKKVRGK